MKNISIIRISLIVFILLSWLLQAMPVYSEEQQPAEGDAAEPSMILDLLDSSHAYIIERANGPAFWFDNFFDDPRAEDTEQPSTFIRLKISSLLTEGEGLSFPVRLRARIKIPNASRKLRLIVVGESEDELATTAEEETAAATIGGDETENNSRVGLRYSLYKTLRSKLHLGVGGRLYSPFEYYYRIRYRRLIHIGRHNIVRFNETGYWNSINGYGTTTSLDFERLLTKTVTGRLSLSGTHSEINKERAWGITWGVRTSFFRKFSPKTAGSLDLGAYGVTRPDTEISTYRIACRLRKNVLRPWLFLEVMPEVTFPLNELTGKRDTVGAFLLSLEFHFLANESRL